MQMKKYMCVSTHACMYVCMYVYIIANEYIYIDIDIYVCMYMNVH